MQVLQRPSSTSGLSDLVLQKDDGTELHLLTVSDYSREQSKRMWRELEANAYRYVAKYCNGGLPTDLDLVLRLLEERKVPRTALHLQKDREGKWLFWGDVGETEGFCFILLDKKTVYSVMAGIRMPIDQQYNLFMHCHAFKAKPVLSENAVYFTALAGGDDLSLPAMFIRDRDDRWHIPEIGVEATLANHVLTVKKQLFPSQKQG
ncbi:hypothetical protein [Gulbenkiania mobilis]|uniref:hypothetical protein n=1 Tax=Gulbenkiania mobilis TaxID=397457 RepID=UPI0006BBCFE6|nr:hypothetical protein [Gulbenkiania mobilis]